MKDIDPDKFREILRDNGMLDHFSEKLQKNSSMFPAKCTGKVEYLFMYDLYKLGLHARMDVEIVFEAESRYSQIKNVKFISMDEFINTCFRNRDFQKTYEAMLNCIYRK